MSAGRELVAVGLADFASYSTSLPSLQVQVAPVTLDFGVPKLQTP